MLDGFGTFYQPDLEPIFFRSGGGGVVDYARNTQGRTSPLQAYEAAPPNYSPQPIAALPSDYTTQPLSAGPVIDPLPPSVLSVSDHSEGGETVTDRETVTVPMQETDAVQYLSGVVSQSQKRTSTQVDPLLLMAGLGFAGLILIRGFAK